MADARSGMQRAVLDVMNEGLRGLEPHRLLTEPATTRGLARLGAHTLAFAEDFGRLLERRVARNRDKDRPTLATVARLHLRIHRPLVRGLRTLLVELGHAQTTLDELGLGPRGRACLERGAKALDGRDPVVTHVVLVQGLECLCQMIAKRGADLAVALGGTPDAFRHRHDGHESLLFLGLDTLGDVEGESRRNALQELRGVLEDAYPMLDEWWESDPPRRPKPRTRSRGGGWGTSDLPKGAA